MDGKPPLEIIEEEEEDDDDINIHEAACESFSVHLMMLNVTPLSLPTSAHQTSQCTTQTKYKIMLSLIN